MVTVPRQVPVQTTVQTYSMPMQYSMPSYGMPYGYPVSGASAGPQGGQ